MAQIWQNSHYLHLLHISKISLNIYSFRKLTKLWLWIQVGDNYHRPFAPCRGILDKWPCWQRSFVLFRQVLRVITRVDWDRIICGIAGLFLIGGSWVPGWVV